MYVTENFSLQQDDAPTEEAFHECNFYAYVIVNFLLLQDDARNEEVLYECNLCAQVQTFITKLLLFGFYLLLIFILFCIL